MADCIPTYKQKIKSEECKKIMIREWNEDNEISLQECFESTDLCELCDENCDINVNVDVFTPYVQFCINILFPTKEVNLYPNNKPWMTKDIKWYINKKKRIYLIGDRGQLRTLQGQLKFKIT